MKSFQIFIFEKELLRHINTLIILDIVKQIVKKKKRKKKKKYALYLTNKILMDKFPPDFYFILNSLNCHISQNEKPLWTFTEVKDIKNLVGEEFLYFHFSNTKNISEKEFKKILKKIDIKYIDKEPYLAKLLYQLNKKKIYSLVAINLVFMLITEDTKIHTFLDSVYIQEEKNKYNQIEKDGKEYNHNNNYMNHNKSEIDALEIANVDINNNNNNIINQNEHFNNDYYSYNNNNNMNNENMNNNNNNMNVLHSSDKQKWNKYQPISDIYDATFFKHITILSFHYSFFFNFFEYLNNISEICHTTVLSSSSDESEHGNKKIDLGNFRKPHNNISSYNSLNAFDDNTKNKTIESKKELSTEVSSDMLFYTGISNNDMKKNSNEEILLNDTNLNELNSFEKELQNSIDMNNMDKETTSKYINSTQNKKNKKKRKLYIFDLIPKLDTYRKMYLNMLSLNFNILYLISAN